MNRSIGFLFLFTIVIYLSFIYSNNTFNKDKVRIEVKEVPLPTSYKDYFNQKNLIIKYSAMFGQDSRELNLINSGNYNFEEKADNIMYVPQRYFIS